MISTEIKTKNEMKQFFKIFIFISVFGFSTCHKKDELGRIVEPIDVEKSIDPLDIWLDNQFLKAYNIDVDYKWNAFEVPLDKNLTPPIDSVVQPTMESIKKIWIDTYQKVAGDAFIKTYCMKQFVLVGSLNFNRDGTITLGTAEGGRKVVIYDVNRFDRKNADFLKNMIHTIQHEFGHILHQNKLYPNEYKQISKDYTSNWYNRTDQEALDLGFITPYASNNVDEDFVEMIATMLVEGKGAFDKIVESSETEIGKEKLRRKELTIIKYYRDTYKIDFRALQAASSKAIIEYTK